LVGVAKELRSLHWLIVSNEWLQVIDCHPRRIKFKFEKKVARRYRSILLWDLF
jgi:hypothetical protein